MNFIEIYLSFSSFVGINFYNLFLNRYAEYCEKFTKNNYSRIGIKTIKNTKVDPKKNKKKVRFNDVVENYYD